MKRLFTAFLCMSCAHGAASSSEEIAPSEPSADETKSSAPSSSSSVTPPAPACDVTKPFGAPVLMAQLSGPDEDLYPRLSADGLVIYFLRTKPGVPAGTFYTARRASRSEPFSPPVPSSLAAARAINFTADGLTLMTDVLEGSRRTIQVATRPDASALFDGFTKVTELLGPGDDAEPTLVPDGSAVYFATWRGADTSWSIWSAARKSSGEFEAPRPVAAVNRAGSHEVCPVISSDDRTLYFASDRPGGYGSWDIWVTTRASKLDSFGEPVVVSELSSATHDVPAWLSPDGCEMILSSYRGGTSYDVYSAKRP